MLHGVLSSLGECSYHRGLFPSHKNSNLNIFCTHRTQCTSHHNPKVSIERGKMYQIHQPQSRGSKALLQVGRVLHTYDCSGLTLGFLKLPEEIDLGMRSTSPSSFCWQTAPELCFQVLTLLSLTCSVASDLAMTQNGTWPHIPEKV